MEQREGGVGGRAAIVETEAEKFDPGGEKLLAVGAGKLLLLDPGVGSRSGRLTADRPAGERG